MLIFSKVNIIELAKMSQIRDIKECINQNHDVNATDGDTYAIIEAAKRNELKIVEMLIAAGAKPDVENRRGETAEFWAKMNHNEKMADTLAARTEQTQNKMRY